MADMDTAAKRLSTIDWDAPFMAGIPIPTGASSAGARQHGMWMYSGIASGAPSEQVATTTIMQDPTPRRPTANPATRTHSPQSSRQEQMGFGGWGFALPRFA